MLETQGMSFQKIKSSFFGTLDVEQEQENEKEQRRKRKGKGIYHHVNINVIMQFILKSSLVPTGRAEPPLDLPAPSQTLEDMSQQNFQRALAQSRIDQFYSRNTGSSSKAPAFAVPDTPIPPPPPPAAATFSVLDFVDKGNVSTAPSIASSSGTDICVFTGRHVFNKNNLSM